MFVKKNQNLINYANLCENPLFLYKSLNMVQNMLILCMNILYELINRFSTKKISTAKKFLMYFFVFGISYVFLCFFTFVFYYFFRWKILFTIIQQLLTQYHMIAAIKKKINEGFVYFWKKSISIGFVHKSQNLAIFGPTLTYKRSRNF